MLAVAALARGAAGQLNLLVVGDWGGASTAPYTTAVQTSVAAAMGAVGAANQITEVFGVGDNFYEDGISCSGDHSPRHTSVATAPGWREYVVMPSFAPNREARPFACSTFASLDTPYSCIPSLVAVARRSAPKSMPGAR